MSGFMNAADTAVYTKLTGASALTSLLAGTAHVYKDLAPEGTDPPYVVFQTQSPSVPQHTFGGVAFENALYTVRGVTAGPSAAAAGTIAVQIDAALADQALTISGHTHLVCRRVQDVDYPELAAGGQRYVHRGATYRIVADPA